MHIGKITTTVSNKHLAIHHPAFDYVDVAAGHNIREEQIHNTKMFWKRILIHMILI